MNYLINTCMRVVQQHQINKSNNSWKEIDELAFDTKNLYNKALYEVNEYFRINETYSTNNGAIYTLASLNKLLGNDPKFNHLPNRVIKQVFIQIEKVFKSYFAAIKEYKKNPKKFTGYPQKPKYKPKAFGRNKVTYTYEAISFKKKKGFVNLSMTNIFIKTNFKKGEIKEVRLIPKPNHYVIEVVYIKEEVKLDLDPNKQIGIDLGVKNLAALASNDLDVPPILINGRLINSTNQYYHKKLADLKSKLPKGKKKSKAISKLTTTRNNKVKDLIHKASRLIVNYAILHRVSKLVIGKNDLWKQNISIGKRNNQNFYFMPHAQFIEMIQYKCALVGIEVVVIEESYTSKCSFLDNEPLAKKPNEADYLGKRKKRGLFVIKKTGTYINADINGALNILRKEAGDHVFDWKRVEGYAVSPMRVAIPL